MKTPAIICDMDGTLAIMCDRSPYQEQLAENDLLNVPVAKVLELFREKGYNVLIVSGRDEFRGRKATENWLTKYNIGYDQLHMRKAKDNRKDSIVKQEIYDNHIKDNYEILFVLDDRDSVVELWRKVLGLTCFQVNYGNF